MIGAYPVVLDNGAVLTVIVAYYMVTVSGLK